MESLRIIWAMIRGRPEPPSGKFLAEQRLAYGAIGMTSLVLLLTGLVKSLKNLGPVTLEPSFLTWATLIHTGAAMVFMGLIGAHLAAFLIRANRPLMPSMFTGRVSRDYAVHRHPLWRWEGRDVRVPEAAASQVEGSPPVQ